MIRALVLALVIACTSTLSAQTPAPKIIDSVAILYAQAPDGGMQMRCTATAFDTSGNDTLFLSAAHCVTAIGLGGLDYVPDTPLFLSVDDLNNKSYVRARVVEVGQRQQGYDYLILAAPLTVPLIPLGDEKEERGSIPVTNVAAPAGIGKVSFFGNVALDYIDRPLVQEEDKINWGGAMLVSVPAEGGSSGSAIVSTQSGKIVGVLVGHYRSLVIAVPVSRVKSPPKEKVLFSKR